MNSTLNRLHERVMKEALSHERQQQLKKLAVEEIALNFESYRDESDDIYNDFDDELFDTATFFKNNEEKEFIKKWMRAGGEFWQMLHKETKFKDGEIQF